MKKLLLISLAVVLALSVGLIGCVGEQEEEEEEPEVIELKFGSAWAPPDVFYSSHVADLWMDMITDETDSAVTFDKSWGAWRRKV